MGKCTCSFPVEGVFATWSTLSSVICHEGGKLGSVFAGSSGDISESFGSLPRHSTPGIPSGARTYFLEKNWAPTGPFNATRQVICCTPRTFAAWRRRARVRRPRRRGAGRRAARPLGATTRLSGGRGRGEEVMLFRQGGRQFLFRHSTLFALYVNSAFHSSLLPTCDLCLPQHAFTLHMNSSAAWTQIP